jgi:hypothetical protein
MAGFGQVGNMPRKLRAQYPGAIYQAETTVTLRWSAGWLQTGSWTDVSNLLHEK